MTHDDSVSNPNRLTSTGTRPRKDGRNLIPIKGAKKTELPWDPNPVFIDKGNWWFYDANWTRVHGPYDSVEELDEAFAKYAESL